MKALAITIKPQYLVDILNGNKTLELRTWIPKDFKGWVYVICGKGKPIIWDSSGDYDTLNGKVVCRFWFDEYDTIDWTVANYHTMTWNGYYVSDDLLNKSCLTNMDLWEYGKGKPLYAWHIKRLEIFPKPMELGELAKLRKSMKQENKYYLTKAPQKCAYVWVKEEK